MIEFAEAVRHVLLFGDVPFVFDLNLNLLQNMFWVGVNEFLNRGNALLHGFQRHVRSREDVLGAHRVLQWGGVDIVEHGQGFFWGHAELLEALSKLFDTIEFVFQLFEPFLPSEFTLDPS